MAGLVIIIMATELVRLGEQTHTARESESHHPILSSLCDQCSTTAGTCHATLRITNMDRHLPSFILSSSQLGIRALIYSKHDSLSYLSTLVSVPVIDSPQGHMQEWKT